MQNSDSGEAFVLTTTLGIAGMQKGFTWIRAFRGCSLNHEKSDRDTARHNYNEIQDNREDKVTLGKFGVGKEKVLPETLQPESDTARRNECELPT